MSTAEFKGELNHTCCDFEEVGQGESSDLGVGKARPGNGEANGEETSSSTLVGQRGGCREQPGDVDCGGEVGNMLSPAS